VKPNRISWALAAIGMLLAFFPVIFSNPAITTIAVFTLLFAAAATGWNIFSGYTGYISIGHAAYYGLGAYFFTLFCQLWNVQGGWMPFLLVPLVGLAAAVCALPVGWVALKTRSHRFLIITVAIFVFSTQIPNFLGNTPLGGAELSLPIPLWSGAAFNYPFYYVAFVLLALALAASWWIRRSKYGLALLAIRDDEDRALGMGVRTGLYKLSAFLISVFFVSIVGAVSAYFLGFIAPASAFDVSLNLLLPLLALFGGIGTQLGPALGAFVLVPLQQNLTLQFGEQNWDLILFGAVFMLVVLLLPEGVLPTLRKRAPSWLEKASTRFPQFSQLPWLPGYRALAVVVPTGAIAPPPIDIATPVPVVATTPEPEALAMLEPPETFFEEEMEYGVNEDDDEEATEKRPVPLPPQARPVRVRSRMALAPMTPRALISTQRMKAIRLVGAESDIIREKPPEVTVVPALTSSTAPTRTRARTMGGTCPRCGSPLRTVESMVFCRKCGLIVSKNTQADAN
jgi:branched-chain amino acid transport system permease protein